MSLSKKIATKKDIAKALIGAGIILLAIDITPIGGNVIMYAKWLQCGRQPIQSSIMIVGEVNHYIETKKFAILRGYPAYFCNMRDAELAGFSAKPTVYEFPHLSSEEREQAIKKSYSIGQ